MFGLFFEALSYAAEKHQTQRKQGCDLVPYINHPIKVVYHLNLVGKIDDFELLSAAILHDVLEDTCTTEFELRNKFGAKITDWIIEVTDNMNLTYEERKRYQVMAAPTLSAGAKVIKIADKTCNIVDLLNLPLNWSNRRKRQYVEWAKLVVDGCRGINPQLDHSFDDIYKEAMQILAGETTGNNSPNC